MEEANNSNSKKNKSNINNNNAKNNVDYIENEVTTKSKSSNDEIINNKNNKLNSNNNNLIESKGKGKNNNKKKKKQKNAQQQIDKINADNLASPITTTETTTETQIELTADIEPNNEFDEDISPSDINLPLNEAINAVALEAFPSTKPTIENILLNDNETVDNSINTDLNDRPLTPKLFVEEDDHDDVEEAVKSDLPNEEIVENSVINVDHEENLLVIKETTDDDYDYNDNEDDYYDDDDDGDNGLLVQFLDEANRIVSILTY